MNEKDNIVDDSPSNVETRDSIVTNANADVVKHDNGDSLSHHGTPSSSHQTGNDQASNHATGYKQSIRVTRSDPLSSTCDKSHLIRSKHHPHHHYSSVHSQPSSNYHSRERRARWIRDRMNYNNSRQNSRQHENFDDTFHCCCCDTQERNHCCQQRRHHHPGQNCRSNFTSSEGDFDWTKYSDRSNNNARDHPPQHHGHNNSQNSGMNWISENDSKASRFHRPYSVREQQSWMMMNDQEAEGDHHLNSDPYKNWQQHRAQERLRSGHSLPSSFQLAEEAEEITSPTKVTFLEQREKGIDKEDDNSDEDEEDDEDQEEEQGGEGDISRPPYLSRQKKLPYPYNLKDHRRQQSSGVGSDITGNSLSVSGTPLQLVRRSRSGSPCSITSESTESLGDCENALDPPRITLPNGDIGGGPTSGGAVPVATALSSSYGSNGGGRKFSVLFYSNDTWNEENIIQSFKELNATATSVFEAAWTGNVEHLEKILSVEENLEKLKDSGPNGFRDGEGRTPLHLASACGNVQCVEVLLQKGAPVNATDGNENRATPLSCAASCGSVPVVRALLSGGANVNEGYDQGKTALHWAIQASSVDCAKILLEAGAKQNPPQVFSETPLHVSASLGDPECLQLLLDYGADVNLCKGSNRSTAVHLAAEEGSSDCVKRLLKSGASHAAKDIRGHTALHVAATCDADCVITLLKAGADPNAVDANGRTPLHCAVARGSRAAECVRLLVDSGADADAQDNYGYTPLHLSAVNESSQCASILLHHGSDVTIKTNAGTTALSLLVRRIPDVMRYLVERLDSAVTVHDHDPADPDCEVRLDFRAIVPSCEKRQGNGKSSGNGHVGGGGTGGSDKLRKQDYFSKPHKETEFLTCLVGAGNKKILAHPLSEAFLTLKWRRVRKFFWASLLFQIALVALFTIYVVEVYLIKCPYKRDHHFEYNQSDEIVDVDVGGDYDGGGGVNQKGRSENVTAIPPLPLLDPNKQLKNITNATTIGGVGDSHNVTRRSADPKPEPGFQWFRVKPPKKENRTRTSKKNRTIESLSTRQQQPPSPSSPTQRSRGRGGINIIIGGAPAANVPPQPPSGGPTAAPATGRPPSDEENEHEKLCSEERSPRIEPIHCQLTPFLQVIWILLVAFASMMAVKEIFQLLQSPFSYVVSSENWGQWLLISSVVVTAWGTPEFQLEYWQYPAAACGIFLAWGLMLLQVGRFPALGLYVQMLGKVAANFGLFILAYACLLIAFALAFCVLFPEHPPYTSVPLSILKVFTMMVGEVDYEDLFYSEERMRDPDLFFLTAHVLYGAFVVIVTIVLMNLLVGLAVHDIQGLQKGAKLNRLSRQTALISRLESFIFSKKLQTVLPRSLGSILQKSALLVPSSYNWSFYFRPNDPRDKRLPKDIKLSSLRLAASHHSCTKSKSPHRPNHPHGQSTNHYNVNNNSHHHRSTHVTTSNTPLPIVRPLSSVSHHPHLPAHHSSSGSALLPHHPEIAMRRVEQRLDHLQNQLEKALTSLNGRLNAVLKALEIPADVNSTALSSRLSSKTANNMTPSVASQKSDNENDSVFMEEMSPTSPSGSKGGAARRTFSTTPSFFERCQM